MNKFTISNSKLTTFWSCEQLYWYKYGLDLTTKTREIYLPIGSTYHTALSTYLHPNPALTEPEKRELALKTIDRAADEHEISDEASTIKTWFLAYVNDTVVQEFLKTHSIISVEQWTETFIFEHESVPISAIAKSDALALNMSSKKLWVIEHKTAKSTSFNRERALTDGSQIAQYSYVLRSLLNKEIYGVYFHILVKNKKPIVKEISALIDETKLSRWLNSCKLSVSRMFEIHDGATPIQNLQSCNSLFGECPFKPACNFGIENSTVSSLYTKKETREFEGIKI